MRIVLNGEERQIPDGLTVEALIAHVGLSGPVAVERNRELVLRAEHASTSVVDGDTIEIVHFVGGG